MFSHFPKKYVGLHRENYSVDSVGKKTTRSSI